MTAQSILGLLKKVKQTPNGWAACCPVHEDNKQSLAIKLDRDKLLFHCFAGCATQDICSAIGITVKDLFMNNGTQKAQIVATYDYEDEEGFLLYQVVRYDPKDFKQRTPDGDGWRWGTKGVRRVLFRLPQLIQAVQAKRPVYVTEGEKDALAIEEQGFAATCNCGGAGKWLEDYNDALRGAEVIVVADKDKSGRAHAIDVAKQLTRIADVVKLIELPDLNGKKVKDAYDYFKAGGNAPQMDEIASYAPIFDPDNPQIGEDSTGTHTISFIEALSYDATSDPNTIIGVVDGKTTRWLCKGQGAWLIAQSGIGKSTFLVQIGCHWVLGRPWAGITPVKPLRILMLQAENDIGDLAEMVQGVARGLGIDVMDNEAQQLNQGFKIITSTSITGERFCEWMGKEILKHKADLVMVDPLLSFAGIDVSKNDQCSLFCRNQINPVLAETGAALIGAHHTGKPKNRQDQKGATETDQNYLGLGGSELVNWARAINVIVDRGGVYELKLLKRGERAGAHHIDGSSTRSIWMRKSEGQIWWEQIPPPVEQIGYSAIKGKKDTKPSIVGKVMAKGIDAFLEKCPLTGEGQREISERLHRWTEEQGLDISFEACRKSVIPALVEIHSKLQKRGDKYYRI